MESTYEKLEKEIKDLKHKKDVLDGRIQKLSEDELRYLAEIPKFKKQSENQKLICDQITNRTTLLREELDRVNNDLKSSLAKLEEVKADMKALRDNADEILTDVLKKRKEATDLLIDTKAREVKCGEKERLLEARELDCKKREDFLFKGQCDLDKDKTKHDIDKQNLKGDIDAHVLKVQAHEKREITFNENRKAHISKEELLKLKLQDVDKTIKENNEIQMDLVFQKKELIDQTTKAKLLQESLDRNIADLSNEKKRLQILELRIKKLAHDAGLDKELAELLK